MDQIAAAAARCPSRPSTSSSPGKQSLFREIVADTVAEVADPVARQVASLRDSGDLEADLRDLAHALLAQVIQPRVMQLRRLVIAERAASRTWAACSTSSGPGRTIAALATAFQHLAARGALQASDDPQTAAEHFNWLVMSTPVNRVMLCGYTELPDRASLSPLRRCRDPGIPCRLRPELTSPAAAGSQNPH